MRWYSYLAKIVRVISILATLCQRRLAKRCLILIDLSARLARAKPVAKRSRNLADLGDARSVFSSSLPLNVTWFSRVRSEISRSASDWGRQRPRFLDLRLSERATYTALTPTRGTYMSVRPAGERDLHMDKPHGDHWLTGRASRARLSATRHYTRQRLRTQ